MRGPAAIGGFTEIAMQNRRFLGPFLKSPLSVVTMVTSILVCLLLAASIDDKAYSKVPGIIN